MNVKFFSFFLILKTKCNRVRERAFFYPFSHPIMCSLQNILKEKLCIHQKFFSDFLPTNAHIFLEQVIFDRKVFKMQRYSSVTLHVSPKTPISAEKLKITFAKNQNFARKFLSSVVWSITNWSFTFFKWISRQISSNWRFQRNVDFDLERAQTSEHSSKDTNNTQEKLDTNWDMLGDILGDDMGERIGEKVGEKIKEIE